MSTPRITSVEYYRKGAHDEVYVFVDCQLSGILRVDGGQGARLAEIIRQGAELAQHRQTAAEHLRDAACVSGEAPWLVKDFNVLYRVADEMHEAALAIASGQKRASEGAQCAHQALAMQLARLRTAFDMTETIRTARQERPLPLSTGLRAQLEQRQREREREPEWLQNAPDLMGRMSEHDTPAPPSDALEAYERTKRAGEGD